MRVKLNFYNNENIVNIFIYKKNKLIYKGITYNFINICLDKNNVYKIKAISNNKMIITSFLVNKNNYVFSFNNNTITFTLRDIYNYPIERGEIILWQK